MARFGGNEFTGFSVPLAFMGRYFILEPGNPQALTVVLSAEGKPVFEVLRNQPRENPFTNVSATPAGILAVSEKGSNRFLYKVRPSSETSVVFGTLAGSEITVRISDRAIWVNGSQFKNDRFVGRMVGILIKEDGSIGVGAPIPHPLIDWLTQ